MTFPDGCPFHLALPVHDLEAAEHFYVHVLGAGVGRVDPGHWLDLNLGGHQVSLHLKPEACASVATNAVDGDAVPVRHFGLVLPMPAWRTLAARLEEAQVDLIVPPKVRFAGQAGEQATLFVRDPSGNALEFKSFADKRALFARD